MAYSFPFSCPNVGTNIRSRCAHTKAVNLTNGISYSRAYVCAFLCSQCANSFAQHTSIGSPIIRTHPFPNLYPRSSHYGAYHFSNHSSYSNPNRKSHIYSWCPYPSAFTDPIHHPNNRADAIAYLLARQTHSLPNSESHTSPLGKANFRTHLQSGCSNTSSLYLSHQRSFGNAYPSANL